MASPHLVRTGESARRNILAFESELAGSKPLQRILGYAPSWFAVRTDGGFAVAPSKWVGYEKISASLYLSNNGKEGDLDGRDTDKVLKQWSLDISLNSAVGRQVHERIRLILERYGRSPHSRLRLRMLDTSTIRLSNNSGNNFVAEWVVHDPAICGGKPTLRGTRIRVVDVLEYLAGGDTEELLLEEFPSLRPEHIRAALSYAAGAVNHRVVQAA